jgi:hypothetical protein
MVSLAVNKLASMETLRFDFHNYAQQFAAFAQAAEGFALSWRINSRPVHFAVILP